MRMTYTLTITLLITIAHPTHSSATCMTDCWSVELIDSNCEGVVGSVDASTIFLATDCERYCDPAMGPKHITRSQLDSSGYWIERDGVRVGGQFVADGHCEDLLRFRFDGTLSPQTGYEVHVEQHGFVMAFSTSADPITPPDPPTTDPEPDETIRVQRQGCSLNDVSSAAPISTLLVLLCLLGYRRRENA